MLSKAQTKFKISVHQNTILRKSISNLESGKNIPEGYMWKRFTFRIYKELS